MSFKIYNKKGNTNYKEKRMIKEITEALEEKAKADPTIYEKLVSANSYEELETMRNSLVASDVQFQEVRKEEETTTTKQTETSNMSSNSSTIDPLNRNEPIIRDYVVEPHTNSEVPPQSSFTEPVDFKDAFKIPEETEEEEPINQPQGSARPEQKKPPVERVNPHFDDIDSKKQKRKTERFAKAITNLGCDLLEKGYVWFVTKDINEAKIAELEMKGVIDASLMLTLDEHTQVTVKEFFAMQCAAAPEQAKVSKEQREDMTDALVEVFMEKGIAPSPTQNAFLVAASIVLPMGIMAFASNQQNNSILKQLKQMGKHNTYHDLSEDEEEKEEEPGEQTPAMNWRDLEGQQLTDDLIDQQISDDED